MKDEEYEAKGEELQAKNNIIPMQNLTIIGYNYISPLFI